MSLRINMEKVAREAGSLIAQLLVNKFKVTDKVVGKEIEIVSEIDLAIHEFLFDRLTKILDLPVICEEGEWKFEIDRPTEYWLVDPVDGTRSMIEGFAGYATQFALIVEREITNSALCLPSTNEIFSASRNEGAFHNYKRMPRLAPSVPFSTIDNSPNPSSELKYLMRKLNIERYIESGSIGVKILRVAEGEASFFLKQTRVRDWDVAPAMLILEECGGSVKTLDSSNYVLSGNLQKPNLLVTGNLVDESKVVLEKECLRILYQQESQGNTKDV